jgi:RimJ/RimL family protein N-acetyltransferase
MALKIDTLRFIISELTMAHQNALYAIVANPKFFYPYINGNIDTRRMTLPDRVHLYIRGAENTAAQNPRKTYLMGIFDKNECELFGVAVLAEIGADNALFTGADPDRDREIGFFVDADHHGKGIATEAAQALAAWGRSRIGLGKLWASVDPENKASCAILTKLGLQPVTYAMTSKFVDYKGNIRPRIIYGQ